MYAHVWDENIVHEWLTEYYGARKADRMYSEMMEGDEGS